MFVEDYSHTSQHTCVQGLLKNVGVFVNNSATQKLNEGGQSGDVLQICGDDFVKLLLLAAVGNFVAGTGDTQLAVGSIASSLESMPSVAIDSYTGQLVMHTPYDAVRGYFVEALLVLSIIAISRLTFVRNNVYTTVVEMGDSSKKSL